MALELVLLLHVMFCFKFIAQLRQKLLYNIKA
jgi:hypothetical protein